MRRNVLFLIRGIAVMAIVMLAIMFFNMIIDVSRVGYPLTSLLTMNATEARHFSNALNRNFNQLVAVAFTTVAIAVPLTANLYSLKFLEFFIKDRVNAAVLTFVAFADLNNTWVAYGIKDDFVPVFQLHLSLAFVVLGFALLFPYLYYIFRFLHPDTLIARLEKEITHDFKLATKRSEYIPEIQARVAEEIEHAANIGIRSVDRLDRNTAIESVLSLERLVRVYWSRKPGFNEAWFIADPASFLGFSQGAVNDLTTSRSWVEMKFFQQLRQIISAAIPKTHDVLSTTAASLRRLGVDASDGTDRAVCELIMEYFNTFIRLSLQRRDPRSVFIIFDQYRAYANALNGKYPDLVQEIAFYFEYYGKVAQDSGLPFVVESVAHDLAAIVRHSWTTNAPNRDQLLDRFLHYDERVKVPIAGIKKAQALLASYFLLNGHTEPAAEIRQNFLGLDRSFVRNLADELLSVTREKYWEVNERRLNMDYAPADQREKLVEFLNSIQT